MLAILLGMLIHKPEQRPHGLFVHRIDALLAVCFCVNEVTEFQSLEMMGNRRLLQPRLLHDLRHAHGLLQQMQHYLYTFGVAERLEELLMGGR